MKRAAFVLISFLLVVWLIVAIVLEQRHAHLTASLVQAVNRSDTAQAESLLAQGADPNARDWRKYYYGIGTPYRPPWYEKNLAKLMRRKPHVADPYVGPTMLIIASWRGDTAIAQSLLNHGADITKTGTEIMSNYADIDTGQLSLAPPLWEAVREEHPSTVKMLIQRGAPIDSRVYGLTPLMWTDNLEIASALINAGANVNAISEAAAGIDCNTPLYRDINYVIADKDDILHLNLARLLLERGAKVDAADGDGNTPLMDACEGDSIESAKLLLMYGADTSADGPNGGWFLFSSTRDIKMLKLLLAYGADPNARNKDGWTALMQAADQEQTEVLNFLLTHGAAVNVQDKKGVTALMLASHLPCSDPGTNWREQRQTRLRLLRQYGANPTLKDKQGRTAASYFNPNPPMVQGE